MRIKFSKGSVKEFSDFDAVIASADGGNSYTITLVGIGFHDTELDYFADDTRIFSSHTEAEQAADEYSNKLLRDGFLDLTKCETIEIW